MHVGITQKHATRKVPNKHRRLPRTRGHNSAMSCGGSWPWVLRMVSRMWPGNAPGARRVYRYGELYM